jgi:hypothetical protein
MERPRKTSILTVLVAWILVAIPLGWGLWQSVMKSRPLFTGGAAQAPPATDGAGR